MRLGQVGTSGGRGNEDGTSEEFDEVGAEIANALDHFGVPAREKREVLDAVVARKAEVISA